MKASPNRRRRARRVALGGAVLIAALAAGGVGSAAMLSPGDRTGRFQPPPQSITLTWVGDITPGSYAGLPPGDGLGLFRSQLRALRNADIATGNLEGTLGQGGSPKCGAAGNGGTCFAFQAPARYAAGLRRAGFDMLNMANNHAMDYGEVGFSQTVKALREQGLRRTGAPGQIAVLKRNGIRVAFVGFAAYKWANDITNLAAVRRLVAQARHRAQIVVAFMHAGAEGEDQTHVPHGSELAFGENRGDTRRFAHAAVDSGATLVLGSGPHVLRGMERYHGALIAYSLGNFADQGALGQGPVSSLTGLLRVRLAQDGRILAGRWKPLRLEGEGTPVPDAQRSSLLLVRRMSHADFGGDTWGLDGHGRLLVGR